MKLELDKDKTFYYENNFYLTCDPSRISKLIVHYELLKKTVGVPGDIIECGVFKGTSFVNLASFRKFLNLDDKNLIGFDMFGKFPEANFEPDIPVRQDFLEMSGDESIGVLDLQNILYKKGLDRNIKFVEGDVANTIPEYIKSCNSISFINLDTDLYEPAVVILEHLYPLLSPGGILVLDDYNIFPGETKAVDEYFKDKGVTLDKFSFRDSPYYIIKV